MHLANNLIPQKIHRYVKRKSFFDTELFGFSDPMIKFTTEGHNEKKIKAFLSH